MSAVLKQQNSSRATVALWQVAESGDIDRFEELLAAGANINGANHDGVTALMRAARHGQLRMVEALVEHGANLNARRIDGFTALLLAVFFGHREVVKLLIQRGADLNAVTRGGTSAEMWAKARGFQDVAHYLENARKGRQLPRADPIRATSEKKDESVDEENVPTELPALARVMATEQVKVVSPASSILRATVNNAENSPVTPQAIRTLKDPPDIWELVPEAKLQFSPRQAFSAHLATAGTKLVAVLVLVILSTVGWVVLRERGVDETDSRGQQPYDYQSTVPSADHSKSPPTDRTASTGSEAEERYHHADGAHSTEGQLESSEETSSDPTSETVVLSSKRNFGPRRQRNAPRVKPAIELVQNDSSSSNSELTAAPRPIDTRVAPVNRTEPKSLPNTQLITPAASPRRKAKVIQWP